MLPGIGVRGFGVLKMFKFNLFVAKLQEIFFEELSYKEEGK